MTYLNVVSRSELSGQEINWSFSHFYNKLKLSDLSWCFALLAVLAPLALSAPNANAQTLDIAPTPSLSATDDIGVDLKAGRPIKNLGAVSIGLQGSPRFSFGVMASSFSSVGTPIYVKSYTECVTYGGIPGCVYSRRNWQINGDFETIAITPPSTTVPSGFTVQGSMAPNQQSTLTRKDGSVWVFGTPVSYGTGVTVAFLASVTYPDGEVLTYTYNSWGVAVVSNTGYMMRLEGYNPSNTSPSLPTKVVLINLNTDYCSPTATTCSGLTVNWPTYSLVTTIPTSNNWLTTATDSLNRVSTVLKSVVSTGTNTSDVTLLYTSAEGRWFQYLNHGTGPYYTSASPNPCDARAVLAWAKTAAGQWNYSLSDGGGCRATGVFSGTSTGPDGITQSFTDGFTDGLGRKTLYGMAGYNMYYFQGGELGVASIQKPEGNKFDFTYDIRNNLTQTLATGKDGTTTISSSASLPSTCTAATAKTCNKPTYTIDARGKQTDYTYSSDHGGILTETKPMSASGIRPQTRYTYAQISAKYKVAAGGSPVAGAPIWKLAQTSACQTQATCAGTSDEIITTYAYNDNLLPTVVTVKTGTGTVLSTVTTAYDAVGNVISVDGPRSGPGDTTYYFYDAARQKIGEIAPDPDDGAILTAIATRFTYNLDGQVTKIEKGNVTTNTLAALQAFTATSSTTTTYDNLARAVKEVVVSGSTTVSVKQFSYDIRGRLICTAERMNTADFAAPPADACVPSSNLGTFGPDRITKNVYDNAGQLLAVYRGVGTSSEIQYAYYNYSNNGRKVFEIDAKHNKTSFGYDTLDRLSKIQYPNTTVGNETSSTTDYETFTYYENGVRKTWRRRNGQTITYYYDDLSRETSQDLPAYAGSTATEKDVYTGYDNFDRIVYKRFGSATGSGVSYSYDGLSRILATTDFNGRSVNYQYDPGFTWRRLIYPDGNFIQFSLDNINRVTTASLNGSSTVYTQGFNHLGCRTSLSRGVGGVGGATTYACDNIGRLTSLTNNLSGTAYDITWTFSSRNPASQIVTWGASSTLYDYVESATSTESKSFDGLNRDATIAAISGGYDLNGNVSKDGSRIMTYDMYNRLLTATGTGTYAGLNLKLIYDPEGRLSKYSTDGGTSYTTFLYDGTNLIGEYVGTAMTNRYVHGTGTDEPVVWYQGSGVTATDQKFLYQNYQGSVIAYTDSAGVLGNYYKYGPYGEPKKSDNTSAWPALTGFGPRFRYTGQTAIQEAGLYYYKARVYDPGFGRFLQTDPVGSTDDLNLYAYVGGDPINFNDPTGLRNCAPDDRSCVETPESENDPAPPIPPSTEEEKITEVVVTAYKKNKGQFNFSGSQERAFKATTTSLTRLTMTQRDYQCPSGDSVTVGVFALPKDASGVHSHTDSHSGVPSGGDNLAANASPTGSAFMVTSSRVFRIERESSGTYRTSVVYGPGLSDSERSTLVAGMQNWESGNSARTDQTPQQRFCP